MNEAQFRQQLQEQGYSEAQALEYEPNSVNDMHSHDFSAFALVLSREFTLVTEDGSVTHQPGRPASLRPVRFIPSKRVPAAPPS